MPLDVHKDTRKKVGSEDPVHTPKRPDDPSTSYGQILKSSAWIGGSSVLTIGIQVIRTKAVAVRLGPAGFGLMGLYTPIIDLALAAANVGIASAGVRQIAESVATGDEVRIARTVVALRRTAIVRGILGVAAGCVRASSLQPDPRHRRSCRRRCAAGPCRVLPSHNRGPRGTDPGNAANPRPDRYGSPRRLFGANRRHFAGLPFPGTRCCALPRRGGGGWAHCLLVLRPAGEESPTGHEPCGTGTVDTWRRLHAERPPHDRGLRRGPPHHRAHRTEVGRERLAELLRATAARVQSARVIQATLLVGVCTRRGIICSHHELEYPYFAQSQPLSRSEAAQGHCVLLPFFACMSNESAETTYTALRAARRAALAAWVGGSDITSRFDSSRFQLDGGRAAKGERAT